MSRPLIARNDDLRRLRDEGYEIEVSHGYVLVHVPYVDSNATIRIGTLACAFTERQPGVLARPNDHTALWAGAPPCHRNGELMVGIKASDVRTQIRPGLVATIHLSNKPRVEGGRYVEPDYYEKFKRYIGIICAPAESLDATVRAATNRTVPVTDDDAPFVYTDTASSRAGINAVSDKLKPLTIAIVGLGGTGAYVLDFVAKTPVKEIRLFDDDPFYSHNAFRAPGAASLSDLEVKPTKVGYLAAQYGKMHKHIKAHDVRIEAATLHLLDGVDFVFICVDDGESRRVIIERLVARSTPFIDAGIGVNLVEETASLVGTVRVTTASAEKRDHVLGGKRIPVAPRAPDDDYRRNIQIADLNALNAVLAVIRWKKLFGVYRD
ncbi:MAG: ThiF family adenylyltransferase, partial [Myxococcales bacterium]|nr:ThiF family adenylyltransferase [Myxococcales bacterium]